MFWTKLKITLAVCFSVILVTLVAGVLTHPALAGKADSGEGGTSRKATKKLAADAKDDLAKLQGAWKVTAMLRNGEEPPDADKLVREARLYITKDLVYLKAGDKGEGPMLFQIDPAQKPKTIDLNRVKGGEQVIKGIYLVEGDDLKLCFGDRSDDPRPTEFASKPESKHVLMILKRDPKAEKIDLEKLRAQAEAKADRQPSAKNLAKIMVAMHDYHNDKGTFPPAAIYDKNGKALLSWRVELLPYLEQDNLYKQFKLDEPWDSPNNKKLLAQMPPIFAATGDNKPKDEHSTFYRVFTGTGTVFEGTQGVKLTDITDGTSNTIGIVEAGETVPWTKPDELPYDPDKPLPKLGGLFKDGFHMAISDGSVRFVKAKFDEKTLRPLITRGGSEIVDFDDLDK